MRPTGVAKHARRATMIGGAYMVKPLDRIRQMAKAAELDEPLKTFAEAIVQLTDEVRVANALSRRDIEDILRELREIKTKLPSQEQ